ncbi:DUF4424 domain-containing protein [Shewanella profunda]|uniref:DUF4424 domain-containing protein n=1 Tax=Shewanella profunda TaxID=254793 RepID=UPI00200D2C1E|nr:DUF4424 domain-containing protein [Shewanella profunda]MCL1091997.1 DUF4424 domain-containing protein [Shewanella profunda]
MSAHLAIPIFAIVLLVYEETASANDSSFGDANGSITLKYQPNISMDKESLYISEAEVRVDYVFTNTSDQDLIVPVAFPMPPMYFGSADHCSIENFTLKVNGVVQPTEHRLVAQLEDKTDISEQLKQLGWGLDEVAYFSEYAELPEGKQPLPVHWVDKDNQVRFTLTDYFVWQQEFPAGKSVAISHTYTPSISTGVPFAADSIIETYAESACLDDSAKKGIKKRNLVVKDEDEDREIGVAWSHLSYILVTANNWQGAIKDFKLTIKKSQATDLMSLCFEGNLKKTDPLTFEFQQNNFIPTQDLSILFIRKPEFE